MTLSGLCVLLQQCVSVEQVPAQVDQESVEIDDFLDNSMAGSSFLFFNGEVQPAGSSRGHGTLFFSDEREKISDLLLWFFFLSDGDPD